MKGKRLRRTLFWQNTYFNPMVETDNGYFTGFPHRSYKEAVEAATQELAKEPLTRWIDIQRIRTS